ncbi:ABC [Ectocarpus sp. CCAP 1310/34]|nr:ABC [Ectocarpus sp. CCAP 1310/34]
MFRSRMEHGGWTSEDWRTKQAKHRAYNASRKSAVASVLHRRAMASNASAHGLPAPFELRGVVRRTITGGLGGTTGHHALPLHHGNMPLPSNVACGNRAAMGATQGFESSGIRRRGATGGAGESGSIGGGSGVDSSLRMEKPDGKPQSTFWRLWSEAKHERGHLAAAGVCLMASSSANLMAPAIMAKVIDRASKRGRGSGPSSSLEMCIAGRPVSDRTFFLACLGVFAVGSLASWGRVYALAMATAGVAEKLRARLFAALMVQEKAFFDEKKAGELAPILAEDVDVSSTVFTERMASVLRSLNSSINASMALLSISPHLTMVSLSTVPMVGSVAMLYYKHVRKLSMRLRDMDSEAQAFAQARLANVRTVRAFANETLEAQRFRQMLEQASELRAEEAGAKGVFRGGLFGMVGVSLMAVLWVGGSHVGDGSMTAGQLTSFAGYTGWVGLGFSGLATGNANIARGLASAERVFALMDRTPAVSGDEGLEPSTDVVGNLEFRDVWFQYPTRDKASRSAVLQGVNLQLSPGKVLALTGASGEGKSTLAALITRLYEPRQGCITLDGVDIATLNPSWLRRQIGVVDQEPVLFAGSISYNIRYGVPSATDKQVEAAAKQANAHDFIMDFPEAYETKVGDEGRQLSGGQKQRVAIARAVLKNPPILILDEATSALDAESERLVSEAIDRVVASRTVLVIAHRQSTVKKADSVAVLQGGTVAEQGTFGNLMAKSGGQLASLMDGSRTV